jgi:dipeptidase E
MFDDSRYATEKEFISNLTRHRYGSLDETGGVPLMADDNVLYSGFSAGICVLADNLKGLDLVDQPDIDPYNYGSIIYNGVGIIDYLPVPHYKSNHPESEAMNEVVKYLESNGLPYKTLCDGDVIVENSSKKQEAKKL